MGGRDFGATVVDLGATVSEAAIAYTILACCRLANVNPVEYLRDMLPRLAGRIRLRDVRGLLPAQWKATREAAVAAATDQPVVGISGAA